MCLHCLTALCTGHIAWQHCVLDTLSDSTVYWTHCLTALYTEHIAWQHCILNTSHTFWNYTNSHAHIHLTSTLPSIPLVPPTFIVTPSNITTIEGVALNLTCSVYGDPPPTVQWLRGGVVLSSQGVYSIATVSRSSSGVYTCTAFNPIGLASADITLDVLCKYFASHAVVCMRVAMQPEARAVLHVGPPYVCNLVTIILSNWSED